jgi:hypothetical protein
MLLENLNYEELLEFYINSYIKEFGERKFQVIFEKIMTSNKISGLISKSRYKRIAPNFKDYIYSLNEIPYFIFARGQTQALAALIALERWNNEVNSEMRLKYDNDLRLIAITIINECKVTYF